MIQEINLTVNDSDVFKVFEVVGDEIIKINYSKQIADININIEGGDILVRWDTHEWIDDECMLIKEKDNFKEIGKANITNFLIKSKDGSRVRIYMCAQLN